MQEMPSPRGAAETRIGKLHHLGFNYDSLRLFCSKFVYDAFLEAISHALGRIENFPRIPSANPDPPCGLARLVFRPYRWE